MPLPVAYCGLSVPGADCSCNTPKNCDMPNAPYHPNFATLLIAARSPSTPLGTPLAHYFDMTNYV